MKRFRIYIFIWWSWSWKSFIWSYWNFIWFVSIVKVINTGRSLSPYGHAFWSELKLEKCMFLLDLLIICFRSNTNTSRIDGARYMKDRIYIWVFERIPNLFLNIVRLFEVSSEEESPLVPLKPYSIDSSSQNLFDLNINVLLFF